MQIKDLEKKSKFFKALGEPVRLKIIQYLLDKEECSCTCNLSKYLKKDQSVIFRHLQILKNAGIINTKKEAQFLRCCLKDKQKIKNLLGE